MSFLSATPGKQLLLQLWSEWHLSCPSDAHASRGNLGQSGFSHHRYFAYNFLKEPGDPGQSLSRRAGPPSLGELWGEGVGAAERVCLFVETGDPETGVQAWPLLS